MTLGEAHDYMDLLLDKADQPYFTANEKNRFIDIATFEYINKYYKTYGVNQESRDRLRYYLTSVKLSGYFGRAPYEIGMGENLGIDNYMHLISADVNGKKAKILSAEEFTNRVNVSGGQPLTSSSDDPFTNSTSDNPIVTVSRLIGEHNDMSVNESSGNNTQILYHPGTWDQDSSVATALAVLDSTSGDAVDHIEIVSQGSGYSVAPIVYTFYPSSFGGTQAVIDSPANINNDGFVTSINVTSGGAGHSAEEVIPTIQIAPPDNNYAVDDVNIMYIRTPQNGKGSEELQRYANDHAFEIVKTAVRMMGASVESSNYDIFDQEVQKNNT